MFLVLVASCAGVERAPAFVFCTILCFCDVRQMPLIPGTRTVMAMAVGYWHGIMRFSFLFIGALGAGRDTFVIDSGSCVLSFSFEPFHPCFFPSASLHYCSVWSLCLGRKGLACPFLVFEAGQKDPSHVGRPGWGYVPHAHIHARAHVRAILYRFSCWRFHLINHFPPSCVMVDNRMYAHGLWLQEGRENSLFSCASLFIFSQELVGACPGSPCDLFPLLA